MSPVHEHAECLIVGAGMAGLTAAYHLKASGRQVAILEKSRGVGGRMATRRDGDAIFDHGVQTFVAIDDRFQFMVRQWVEDGVALEWSRGFSTPDDHHKGLNGDMPYYRGTEGMNGIAKHLARDLDVRLESTVHRLEKQESTWIVHAEEGKSFTADRVVLTCPVPQARDLLQRSGVHIKGEAGEVVEGMVYQSQFAVLAVLEGESGLPEPGAIRLYHDSVQWIADNRMKGISPDETAVTLIAHPRFSRENLHSKPANVGEILLESVREHLASPVKRFQVHRWLYSKPVEVSRRRFIAVDDTPSLLLAGDAFCRVKSSEEFIEGAAMSGYAVAQALRGAG